MYPGGPTYQALLHSLPFCLSHFAGMPPLALGSAFVESQVALDPVDAQTLRSRSTLIQTRFAQRLQS
ncbi:MAG: hypothetical protein R3C18_11315 [Planctomycetaceae bacterium]